MKEILIPDILTGVMENKTREQIAADLGVSPATLWRRMQKDDYRTAYSEILSTVLDEIKGDYIQALDFSVKYLYRLIKDDKTDQSLKVRIALSLVKAGTFQEARA